MNDPAILFVKPKAISSRDKKELQGAGILVIEIDDPASAKFTRACAELSNTEMLGIALKAIATNTYASHSRGKFADLVIEAFMAKNPPLGGQ